MFVSGAGANGLGARAGVETVAWVKKGLPVSGELAAGVSARLCCWICCSIVW